MKSIGVGYLNTVGSAMTGALSDLVKGREVSAAKIIETIGDQMVASGTQHLMEGIAMQFIPLMQGFASGLMAAGTAEIATGLVLGAAGARSGGGGSAGGGGSVGPARPTPRSEFSGEADRAGPITINVSTLRADEETGNVIYDSLQKRQNRHGKSASLQRLVR